MDIIESAGLGKRYRRTWALAGTVWLVRRSE